MTKLAVLVTSMMLLSSGAEAQKSQVPTPVTRPPSEETIRYVRRQPAPANPVMIVEEIVIGQPIPRSIELTSIPGTKLAFAIVNHRRLLVDPLSYTVVLIIE